MSRAAALSCYLVLLILSPVVTHAQESPNQSLSAEEQAFLDGVNALLQRLEPLAGDIQLAAGRISLQVPVDRFYFLDAEDANTVLVELWGNPPDPEIEGMLFPAEYSPIDEGAWAVTLSYSDEGYISDDDAAQIDYDALLKEMQEDTEAENKLRYEEGYETVNIVGWAEPPFYDQQTHTLYWAQELRFSETPGSTLNYDIRMLGRSGILSMTFIADMNQLSVVNEHRAEILKVASFTENNRYSDFDPELDKVAAYGIGALVTGKLAAKAGFFATLALIMKKFGVVLLLLIAAMWRRILGFFSH